VRFSPYPISVLIVRGNGNVSSSSRSRYLPPVPHIVTGVVLVILLICAFTFLAVRHTQRTGGTPTQPTAQPSRLPKAAASANSFAIPGCYNRLVPPAPRPMKLNVLGCASVAVALQDMSWSSWGPQGADGTGIAVFKVCEPNCAQGYQLTDQVAVHAWNPQPPRNDSGCPVGLNVFADMIVAFPHGAPPANVQTMNTRYNGMPAVHYVNYSVNGRGDAQFIGYTWCS
jgi:hypothetical protein